MLRAPAINTICRQSGVGLIEILIAVLVLSIGFLGMAALQAKALSNNNSSMMRTQASMAAYSMFDAMRADKANVYAGNYDSVLTVGACPAATATLADVQKRIWCLGYDPNNMPPPLPGDSAYSAGSPPPAVLWGGLAALGAGTQGTIACAPKGGATTSTNCQISITFNDSRATGGKATPNQTLTFWTQL